MLQKCYIKVLNNKVICDGSIEKKEHLESKLKTDEMIKNKKKSNYLNAIGMDLSKYNPSVLRVMIDGGRTAEKIPDDIKPQLIAFATEANDKGFNPNMFGHNTTLHKFIKTINKSTTRPYVKKHVKFSKGGACIPNMNVKMSINEKSSSESSSSESSESETEQETDLDGILSEVEHGIKQKKFNAVKKKLKKYKHRIPAGYYNKIMGGLINL